MNDDGSPEVWDDDDGNVFVPFDVYIENAPTSACSVIYRLDESYNDGAKRPEDGQFHEVTGADDKFYLRHVNSEDDYTVEAYMRWNDGRSRMIKRTVTAALRAHYRGLTDEMVQQQKVDRILIEQTIVGLENENLLLKRPAPRKKAARPRKR